MKVEKRIAELQEEMGTVETALNDTNTPAEVKASLQEAIDEMNAELKKLTAKAKPVEKKPKKEEKPKPKIKIDGKDLEEITGNECLDAYRKRREQAKADGKKFKTASIISRVTSGMAGVMEQTVASVASSAEFKDNPEGATKVFEKIGDIIETTLEKIKNTLKPYLESEDLKMSEQAKKDLQDFENLVTAMKAKYN